MMESFPFPDIVKDVSGGNLKVKKSDYLDDGSIPVIDQSKNDIGGYTNDTSYQFSAAPLPIVVFGDHTCCVKHMDQPFAMGADGVKVLKPAATCDAKYLFHFLNQVRITDGGYDRHFKYLKRIEIPLPMKNGKPDLDEQRRIAGILDQADAIRRKRRQALQLTDDFLRSTFLDLFGDPVTNPKRIPMGTLGDLVERLDGGKNLAESITPTSYRVLKVSAVTTGKYKPDASKYVPSSFHVPRSYIVNAGDLLVSRANTRELIGATAYVWDTPKNIMLPDKIWKFIWRDAKAVDPLYVHALTRFPGIQTQIGKRASGTSGSMKNIAKPKLLGVPIPIPSPNEQRKFGDIAREIQKMSRKIISADASPDALFASLQQLAFKGKL